ncbi:MAG: methyltransferase family protein [Bacteroidales bacterium]
MDNKVIIAYGPYLGILKNVLVYGSLAMFFWAFFFDYDSLSFFGIRQILNFGKTNDTKPSDEIKKNGLLGLMRHPMYLALLIYIWSQTSKMADIVVNVVLTVYIYIGTLLEEKKLLLEFGQAYSNYQKEVPMLIPFLRVKAK